MKNGNKRNMVGFLHFNGVKTDKIVIYLLNDLFSNNARKKITGYFIARKNRHFT